MMTEVEGSFKVEQVEGDPVTQEIADLFNRVFKQKGVIVLGRLEPVSVLDWYDGLVVALVRPTWKEGICLASLVAWSQELRRRVYALIPVDVRAVESILSDRKMDWEVGKVRMREICDEVGGKVALVCCDENRDEVIAEIPINYIEVRRELLSSIEEALDPSRMRWLDRV